MSRTVQRIKRVLVPLVVGWSLALAVVAQDYIVPGRPRPAGAAFSPDDVTGLVLWFETDYELTIDGFGANDWTDRSTSANDLTQSTDGEKMDLVSDHFASGIDGLQGDGIDDEMGLDSRQDVTGDFSLFYVVEFPTSTGGVLLGESSNNFEKGNDTGGTLHIRVLSPNTNISVSSAFSYDTEVLVEIYRDSSNDFTCFVDAVDKTGTPPSRSGQWQRRYLAKRTISLEESDTIFGAILIYDNKVSDANRASIRTYLNDKYTLY